MDESLIAILIIGGCVSFILLGIVAVFILVAPLRVGLPTGIRTG